MSHPRLGTLTATTAVAAAAVGAIALAAPATAASGSSAAVTRSVTAADPDDVGNRLDIVRERFSVNDNGTVTLTIRTAESFDCDYVQNFGENGEPYSAGLLWEFDRGANGSFGDERDARGSFDCEAGRLAFHLITPAGVKAFAASRPSAGSVVVTFPRQALDARHVHARALSRFSGTQGDHTAFDEEDRAPVLKAY